MNQIHHSPAQQRLAAALRLMAFAASAAVLAGCMTTQQQVTAAVPTDYRNRHPIVLREGPRTLDLFVGNNRGTLTGAQRADVLAFAGEWRREATGGILIDLPSGTNNEAAATTAMHEVR